MKKLTMTLVAVIFLTTISCQKEEIKPSQPTVKDQLKECRKCEGSWDLTDTIP